MTDPASLPNFPPPSDEHPLRGRVLDALIDMGMAPDLDADGDVVFTTSDQQLFVRCTEGDFQVMRVFGQWLIHEAVPQDPLVRLQASNDLALQLNIVKTALSNGTLVVTGEHLVTPRTDLKSLLPVTIQLVLAGVQLWHEKVLGGPDAGPGAAQPAAPEGDPV